MPDDHITRACRCGRDTPVHLCHGEGYTCPNPGTLRLYTRDGNRITHALAGVQTKVCVSSTVACDDCWERFTSWVPA